MYSILHFMSSNIRKNEEKVIFNQAFSIKKHTIEGKDLMLWLPGHAFYKGAILI